MQNITNQLFVSKYQLYLPDKKQLQTELEKLLSASNPEPETRNGKFRESC